MRIRNFEPVKSSVEIDAVYEIYNERNEKVGKKYIEDGYHLTTEVKGTTVRNQHWVAITDVEGNNIYC